MGSISNPSTPLGIGALSELRKATASQATASQATSHPTLATRSPRNFPRLRLSYPSVHKSDPVQETEALKEREALLTIYNELASSGKMILYTGSWVTKPVPSTKYEYAKENGKRTAVTEWTKIDYVVLPSDEEGFARIVLTGLYNYFWTKYADTMNLTTLIQAIESGEVSLEEGETEFPMSSGRVFPPVKTVKKAKKRLRDWLEVHDLPRCESSDRICYNTALKLLSRVQDQHKALRDELMKMWPKDIPFFGGIKVEAEGDAERDADGDVEMDAEEGGEWDKDNEAQLIDYLDGVGI